MNNPLKLSLLVGLGGFLGSIARYSLDGLSQPHAIGWPAGTLAANGLGCLLIGIVAGLAARDNGLPHALRLALTTGFCGGFTTMSAMTHETVGMLHAGAPLRATTYLLGTVVLSLAAFTAGLLLASSRSKATRPGQVPS